MYSQYVLKELVDSIEVEYQESPEFQMQMFSQLCRVMYTLDIYDEEYDKDLK